MHRDLSDLDPHLDHPKGEHPLLFIHVHEIQLHFTWIKFYFPLSWGNGYPYKKKEMYDHTCEHTIKV